ncbi:hypothetical protein Scep_027774 [Stephania cephalantha]|uniref:Uncharacterized protein n=1 Tax=Stephania cephalantha TaxID=152367 RepID=A0AAP0HL45_9MAGN
MVSCWAIFVSGRLVDWSDKGRVFKVLWMVAFEGIGITRQFCAFEPFKQVYWLSNSCALQAVVCDAILVDDPEFGTGVVKLRDLYNIDSIFDKFDCCLNSAGLQFATGSYRSDEETAADRKLAKD